MDKWKDTELERMKAGGNRNAKEFFESQPDYRENWSITEKYNSRAAALLRDKVLTEAEGKSWSIEKSPARNYTPTSLSTASHLTSSASTGRFDRKDGQYGQSNMPRNYSYGGAEDSFQNSSSDFCARG
jgi:ADP-ribosylation factor GTPase-activating protein 1